MLLLLPGDLNPPCYNLQNNDNFEELLMPFTVALMVRGKIYSNATMVCTHPNRVAAQYVNG